jgi:hypothetical protein
MTVKNCTQHSIATTLFFDSFYFYFSVKNNAAAMLER